MKILVTSARTPHALGAIRSFGDKGHEVVAADCTDLAPGLHSRFVSQRRLTPPMTERPREWAAWLLEEIRVGKYDLLFPTFEEIFLVARMQDLLRGRVGLLLSPYEMFQRVHHKAALAGAAAGAGVRVPETHQPDGAEAVKKLTEIITYPAVIKLPDVNNSLGLTFVDTPEALVESHAKLVTEYGLSGKRLPVIQPKIEGELLFSLLLADHGETVGQLFYKPLRMFPEGNGTAFYREVVRSPAAEAAAQTFVRHLGWHGFIGFDVIIEKKTGEPVLIDANPRTTPALQTGLKAGVDFTGMAIDISRSAKPSANLAPREGVRTKTLFVEILWFLNMTRIGRGYFKRWREALSVFRKRTFYPDIHRKDDRRPSWYMTLFVFYFLFVINPKRKTNGGFCYSCNYTMETEAAFDIAALPRP
jgi:predicted ATP-grasp superfamily ATP-dependent carboligase